MLCKAHGSQCDTTACSRRYHIALDHPDDVASELAALLGTVPNSEILCAETACAAEMPRAAVHSLLDGMLRTSGGDDATAMRVDIAVPDFDAVVAAMRDSGAETQVRLYHRFIFIARFAA